MGMWRRGRKLAPLITPVQSFGPPALRITWADSERVSLIASITD